MFNRKEIAELQRQSQNSQEAIRKLANAVGSLGSHGVDDRILKKLNRLADEAVETLKK